MNERRCQMNDKMERFVRSAFEGNVRQVREESGDDWQVREACATSDRRRSNKFICPSDRI